MAVPVGGSAGEFNPEQLDVIEGLYVGRVRGAQGTLGSTVATGIEVVLAGEILVYGKSDGVELQVEQIRRIALYGEPLAPEERERYGRISLLGPGDPVGVDPGSAGKAPGLEFTFYSRELSTARDERNRTAEVKGDAYFFPPEVRGTGMLEWATYENGRLSTATLSIVLEEKNELNTVRTLELVGDAVDFVPVAGTAPRGMGDAEPLALEAEPGAEPMPVSLLAVAGIIAPLPAPLCLEPPPCAGNPTVRREVTLCFIDVSHGAEVIQRCAAQLDSVCQIWRNKAALAVRQPARIVRSRPATADLYGLIVPDMHDALSQEPGFAAPGAIRVFVVDGLFDVDGNPDLGGGVAHNCRTADTFIILGYEQLDSNPNLLAHELGHAVGLCHPADDPYPGSDDSIMKPSDAGVNPADNTLWNCRVFTLGEDGKGLSPLVAATTLPDCFRPDRAQ